MSLLAGPLSNLLERREYKLQKGVKEKVKSLADELKRTNTALRNVAQVPYDELHPLIKDWASEAREASYDMEDILDTFLVRFHVDHQPTDGGKSFIEDTRRAFGKLSIEKAMDRRDISKDIDKIMKKGEGINKKRKRDGGVDKYATTTSEDPRDWMILATEKSDLVGINKSMEELIEMIALDDDASNKKMKLVSVVGPGGLGKTTLINLVYEKLTGDKKNICKAFVSVGQKPDLKKVLTEILYDIGYVRETDFEAPRLIKKIQGFLEKKRYFIVIDDVWEVPSWAKIKTAFKDNNLGSRIIITTRNREVANHQVSCTYEIKPLDPDSSKKLFCGRIFGPQRNCPTNLHALSDSILNKYDGVPLAIITIAGLLASKENHDITEWKKVNKAIGSGLISNTDKAMKKILSLSYYDLPSNMKTCFLYLSIYPEDHEIGRDRLIWSWICEGFIQPPERGDDILERGLFELGKSYFSVLINRSLVQPIINKYSEVFACRVHDMILDLICSLSKEENLVTISNGIQEVVRSEGKKLRRLSLRNTTWPTNDVLYVRSMAIFDTAIDVNTSFSCFNMLRVLDLEGCTFVSFNPRVGNLIHLRYLGLRGTGLHWNFPTGIEKLQFLQVLKMDPHVKVTRSIFGLRQLICLEGVSCSPNEEGLLRNLTSLQVLSRLVLNNHTVEELGYLTHLTKLEIVTSKSLGLENPSIYDNLMFLGKLTKLQSLRVVKNIGSYFYTLPEWISREPLLLLTTLVADVQYVRPKDIQILGMLPKLVRLDLNADDFAFGRWIELEKFVVKADAFPCLRFCSITYAVIVPSMFTPGAMSKVKEISFDIRVVDFFRDGGFIFDDLNMNHLTSLQTVKCCIRSGHPRYTKMEDEKLNKRFIRLWVRTPTSQVFPLVVLITSSSKEEVGDLYPIMSLYFITGQASKKSFCHLVLHYMIIGKKKKSEIVCVR